MAVMEQTKKVGIGIAGCGMITASRHGPEYDKNTNAKIIGFYDYDRNRAIKLAEIYGGKVYDSYEELISDTSVQAVSICTPNYLHADQTIAALEMGKDVLCEKPMAPTLKEARSMIDAQKRTGRVLMLGHNQRLVPTHIKAKKLLVAGEIGRVLYVQTNFKHAGPEGWSVEKDMTWFFDKKRASFGVLGDLGSHKIDLIRYLLDDEIEYIFAELATLDKHTADGKPIAIEDNGVCLFKTRGMVSGLMHVSWTNYGLEDNSTVIYGTEGTMKIFPGGPDDIVIDYYDGTSARYQIGAISTNANQLNSGIIDAFLKAIIEGIKPPVSGRDGRNTLACLEAAVRSSAEGKWEKVDLD